MVKKKEIKAVATIDGKKYPLIFGFKFLNEIKALSNDAKDEALTELIAGLIDGEPGSLKTALEAALCTYDDVTEDDIIEYLETSDEVEGLFENFTMYLMSAPLLKKKATRIYKGLNDIKEMLEKQAEIEMDKVKEELEDPTTKE